MLNKNDFYYICKTTKNLIDMYILNDNKTTISPAEKKSFSELGLKERQNLQEWIATAPTKILSDIFGEELLIIQKEFDGFSETRERLDLLALDNKGRLVVIENKLDDSGKDVTWQAIKYASYCSTLSKQEIINIYSKYLHNEEEAIQNILKLLDKEDINEVELNVGENTQRIFFLAANFRKEVTSSVLWLLKFGLDIKCFTVTPFEYNNRILIDFNQIIPIKDAEDYTIRMAAKSQNETQTLAVVTERGESYQKFWEEFIAFNEKHNGLYATAGKDSWLGKAIGGISGITVNVCINRKNCRVEVYICFGEKERNKAAFDFYHNLKDKIQSEMPDFPLTWERMDDKITCRIKSENQLSYINEDQRHKVIEFLTNGSKQFLKTFSQYTDKIKSVIANS